ncbi:hypothetical protein Ahy_B06g084751 [Arachis hypogaea]|uniref:Uncharacterized protein n=1 Tax=Arachis hypogaea TaxID=3818 RepID=A0A444YSN8_ARAHY|nr:hypothetical protein Ahy_B06g084751 [Arachis hypogaea]
MGACKRFKSWIESCSLIDLGAVGARFTWRGPLWENLDRVFKRLDQALSNIDWGLMFPEARVDVLARRNSDHHPLLINTKPQANTRIEKPFRYEAMWSMHPGHKEFIKQAWESNQPLTTALNGTTRHLIKWNKDVFGHVGRQKRRLINRIEGIQRASSYGKNPFLEKLEAKLNEELEDILDKEEVLWMQKSRDLWVVDGDRNTRYYHTRTVIRRRRNKILKLKDQQGDWIEKDEDLKRHAIDFFKCLYEEENETGGGLGEKEAICKKCNYQEKSCLGRYLGAMLTNHRRGKDKFKNVVERMQSKLKGWKMNCLSLAGRITLTKSVLSPMTNFEMQHSKLPKGLCNELERMQRSFIWGEGPDQKKIYHLNWNTLCQPKLQGEYKERSWEIKFQYANRETNQCADWLGKISTNHQYGFNFIDNPPADIKHLLQIDAAEIQTSCSLINL